MRPVNGGIWSRSRSLAGWLAVVVALAVTACTHEAAAPVAEVASAPLDDQPALDATPADLANDVADDLVPATDVDIDGGDTVDPDVAEVEAESGSAAAEADDGDARRRSVGCSRESTVEAGTITYDWGGVERSVIVHLPAPEHAGPRPLLVSLHPSFSSGARWDATVSLSRAATSRGYVVLVPEGMPTPDGASQVWEFLPGAEPDDAGYLSDLVDWAAEQLCLDRARTFAAGYSNGSTMTNVLACHSGGRFAAVGGVGAHRFPVRCPSGPVSVLGIHATGDTIVPYQGGPLLRRPDIWMPPVEETFASWAEAGRCEVAPTYGMVAGDVERRRWAGCARGTEVVLYTILGGGHAWPRPDDPWSPASIDATTLLLDFFDSH